MSSKCHQYIHRSQYPYNYADNLQVNLFCLLRNRSCESQLAASVQHRLHPYPSLSECLHFIQPNFGGPSMEGLNYRPSNSSKRLNLIHPISITKAFRNLFVNLYLLGACERFHNNLENTALLF